MATADLVLAIAAGELGYAESPAGSNRTKYGAWYGQDGQPWCAQFVSWVLHNSGVSLPISSAKGFSYCPYGVEWFKQQGLWHTSEPQPGDMVFFDWYPGTRKSGAWHVGFVEKVNADGTITTIEGNTSLTNQDNGGKVMRRVRSQRLVLGYGRPEYLQPLPKVTQITSTIHGKEYPAYLIGNDSYVLARAVGGVWSNESRSVEIE